MDKNQLIEELEQIEKVFENKYVIDFYEAKTYINEKLKMNIEESLVEEFLKEKGYKNIIRRNNSFVSVRHNEDFEEYELGEPEDINSEISEEEDFDIDDIVDMDFTPNINRATTIDIGNFWLRRNKQVEQYKYSDNTILIKEYQRTQKSDILDIIVELNAKLVMKYATWYSKLLSGHCLTVEDLIQEGCLGLMRAVERFDVSKGYEFSTYASWWIKQVMHRAILDKDGIIRLPVHTAELLVKMRKLELEQIRSYGEVIPEKMCNLLNLSMEKYITYKKYEYQYGNIVSLDKTVGDGEDSELIEFVGEKNVEGLFGNYKEYYDPEILYEEIELSKVIRDVLSTLKEKESTIIKYRFGLIDGRTRTLEEIGKLYNVTRERIRQIEAKALRKLRHPNKSKFLRPFIGVYEFDKAKKAVTKRIVELKNKEERVKEDKADAKKDVVFNLVDSKSIKSEVDTNTRNCGFAKAKGKSKTASEQIKVIWQRGDLQSKKSNTEKMPSKEPKVLNDTQNIQNNKTKQSNKYDFQKLNVEQIISILREQGLKIIDNRRKGGCLWIVGGKELETLFKELLKKGMNFKFTSRGGKTTGYKPGWYCS